MCLYTKFNVKLILYLCRTARSLFHMHGEEEGVEEVEERVVPTYFVPDFQPSPMFLR